MQGRGRRNVAAERLCGALFVGLTTLKGYFYINLGGTPGSEYTVEFVPKVKVEVVLADRLVEEATGVVVKAAKTGKIGDGKVFVHAIEEAIRIRTDETGEQAL